MKIRVNPHTVEIVKEQTEPINEREIKVSKCEFEFDEAITSEFVKEAYFTLNGSTYKKIIQNNECDYPSEVLTEKGTLEIGVVAFLVENEEEIIRYNPSPDYFESWVGSLKDAENSEPITPSEMEQFEQALQEGLNDIAEAVENAERLDVDAEKIDKVTTITITKQDGTTKEVTLEDGMGLNYNWQDTSLGVKREDEETYQYVNLKGDKGDAGAIKMLIVAALPITGEDDTIYLVPLENPDVQGNNYAEYVYINGAWELLGKIGVQVDLTDYVKNTDYATTNKAGVVKTGWYGFMISNDRPYASVELYENYGNMDNKYFISKGTLENIIAGKGLVSNTNYASNNTAGVIKTSTGYGTGTYTNGELTCLPKTYTEYTNGGNYMFISKGTLENVITGKDLTTKAYVDGLVGDIGQALDQINGEVVGGA